jgi:hypothetical protein
MCILFFAFASIYNFFFLYLFIFCDLSMQTSFFSTIYISHVNLLLMFFACKLQHISHVSHYKLVTQCLKFWGFFFLVLFNVLSLTYKFATCVDGIVKWKAKC